MAQTGKYNDPAYIGKKYGMLTVIEPIHHVSNSGCREWWWRVKCDCGNEKVYRASAVVTGRSVSCGCYRKTLGAKSRTHGESHTRLHNIWTGMNNRCNPKNSVSKRYGKRGIKVCEEWHDYTKFRDWALANGYKDGLTIERKNVDDDYCPENCTWILKEKQARNRGTTHWVDYNGKRMSLAEACEIAGLPYKQVFHRIVKANWPVEKALTTPIRVSELKRKCAEHGMNYNRVYNRIYVYGWTEEEALTIPIGEKRK